MLNHSTLLYKLYMRRAVVAVEVIRLVLVAVEVIQLVWAAGLLLVKVAALIKNISCTIQNILKSSLTFVLIRFDVTVVFQYIIFKTDFPLL